MSSDNLCLDECGEEYFNNSGICERCTSPCQTCENNGTDCKSCVATYSFYSATGKCLLECPSSTYSDGSGNCVDCHSNCFNCSGTALTCTACSGSNYLHDSECISSCPHSYYESGNECLACDVSCDGCLTADDECEACANGYYEVINTTTCLNSCPDGSVSNDLTGQCTCSSECATCSGTLSNCLTCSGSLFLVENTCIDSCPGGYYQQVNATNCIECSDTNCVDCDSTECFNCGNSYFLYSGSCLASCPDGTVAVNKDC